MSEEVNELIDNSFPCALNSVKFCRQLKKRGEERELQWVIGISEKIVYQGS